MPGIAIVTDSTCCLTRQEARELGCTVLPMTYVARGERRPELPQGENGDYEAILREDPFVGTESVYQRDFARAFERLLDSGRDVLCVTMSARLSGAHRAAREAAAALDREWTGVGGRVQVVDSWATASGLELVVRQARALADAGLSLTEVADGVREFRGRVGIRFAVPDMRPLRRSGRLGATRRSVAGMLGRYPVFCLREGAIETVEVVRGGISAARELVGPVPADVGTVIVSHFGHADELARFALVELRRRRPKARVLVKDGGPVLTSRLGVGSLALGWADASGGGSGVAGGEASGGGEATGGADVANGVDVAADGSGAGGADGLGGR
ncbi:DegV family protein [Olsenella sp. DNF00959]|uniref:DegV family protein n=1 Tax=Olsenella sp. DNF00959 TaxID=1476999 RepID=UPI0007815B1D|nr:DegV family protein [Olsenella sp. DNF00959]KXB62747.1 EDD domain protein, DegV family [Olsenella sp. DNF00959]